MSTWYLQLADSGPRDECPIHASTLNRGLLVDMDPRKAHATMQVEDRASKEAAAEFVRCKGVSVGHQTLVLVLQLG